MTGALNMGGFRINNLQNPGLPQDAATKAYADSIAGGFTPVPGVQAASTVTLTVTYANGAAGVGATLTNAGAQTAFVIDGYTGVINDRILIKNQSSTFQNGIYTITDIGSGASNWILTRATDYDTPAQIKPGNLVAVSLGTVNSGSSWLETATVTTIGTDPILFSLFFSPAQFLQKANNLSDVASVTTSLINLGLGTPTGTGNVVLNNNPTILIPKINLIEDTNGNNIVQLVPTASAVNFINIANNSTGNTPQIGAEGTDANITLQILGKGTSGTSIQGVTDASNAPARFVGELISVIVLQGGAVAATINVPFNIASMNLSPGDWDIFGNVLGISSGGGVSTIALWSSTTSATQPDGALLTFLTSPAGSALGAPIPSIRLNINTLTTIYLSANINGTGSLSGCGQIFARRRR